MSSRPGAVHMLTISRTTVTGILGTPNLTAKEKKSGDLFKMGGLKLILLRDH